MKSRGGFHEEWNGSYRRAATGRGRRGEKGRGEENRAGTLFRLGDIFRVRPRDERGRRARRGSVAAHLAGGLGDGGADGASDAGMTGAVVVQERAARGVTRVGRGGARRDTPERHRNHDEKGPERAGAGSSEVRHGARTRSRTGRRAVARGGGGAERHAALERVGVRASRPRPSPRAYDTRHVARSKVCSTLDSTTTTMIRADRISDIQDFLSPDASYRVVR